MHRSELCSTGEEVIQRVSVVRRPCLDRIGDSGAHDADQHVLELALRQPDVARLFGDERHEALTDLTRSEAVVDLHRRSCTDGVESEPGSVPDDDVLMSPDPVGSGCQCIDLGHVSLLLSFLL